MKSILAKAQDGTLTLTIPLSLEEIKAAREEAIQHAIEEMELPGFRKGKAPRKVVEEKLDPLNLKEDILRHLLPRAYSEAVLEHKLRPIMSPKINVSKLDDGKEWEFIATTCEMPEVTLKDYKAAVKDVTAKSKIVVPGKEQKEISFDEIMQAVMGKATVVIPSILVESEVDRLLSQMLDEVKTLGLTLDQYLASTHKTVEEVKKDYAARATNDITVEFVLQKIADEEKITVSEKEIEEAITKAPTPAEKENLEKNKYLLAAILRQQKTFDYLKSL
ncbi:MAG TPA: trigger factor [Candidatus Eisenbacteria bacterium]|nr:trigger factor [Candidatus Eisenbacteria bacterium]